MVLDSTWRMMISYSSLGEFMEASVTGEVSGRFHDFPPRTLPLPFCPFSPITPHRRAFQYALHPLCVFRWDAVHFVHGAGEMVQF